MSAPRASSSSSSSGASGDAADEHYAPAVRLCEVVRPAAASCGFHLSRTKWDPYPWVSVVEAGSAAHQAGLQVGDCLLEVNGEDVVGQKISEIASRVRSRPDCASLLVWNCGADDTCDPERMSSCLSAVLGSLECPVCLDTIPPPAHQCGNGHLMCAGCRARAERCPVCRVRLTRGRSLLADQVFLALTDTFNVGGSPREEQPARLRQKLLMLGAGKKNKATVSFTPSAGPANKLLTKLMGKSSSLTNLAAGDEEHVRLSAVPRHLSITPEFPALLKVKSLSTSEINRAADAPRHSPTPSPRSRSPTSPRAAAAAASRVGSGLLDAGYFPLGRSQRPSSCHSSLESLCEAEAAPESLFRCPWSASCPLRLPTARLVSHGRAHGGPLLLAFRPHCDLALPLPGPLCVQLPQPDAAGAPSSCHPRELFVDTRPGPLRAWLAGSPEECRPWRVRVEVRDAHGQADGSGPAAELGVRSLSVDAPDARGDAAVVEAGEGSPPAALPLPPHARRLGLDFAAHPVDALRPGGQPGARHGLLQHQAKRADDDACFGVIPVPAPPGEALR
ncbi:hypothetical protein ONE63_003297 [Megalurothrips usitatus]|uniref:Uncharacterized protein n=1 Tax=Megalurothrips usitatus TaxID=439358 RepID=A0AAV7X7M7_9NEOP|nr:hypothetical protein ONE63_003297 [Megalurothrips usitatus]